MALFGKSTTKKDENKKPSEKAAIKPVKVSKAPKAKKLETKAPIVAKETKKSAKVAKSEVAVSAPAVSGSVTSSEVTSNPVILGPHVTEKANFQNEKHNVYTFKVAETATKHAVAYSIKKDYKVTPTDVRFVSMPGKTIVYRGRYAFKAGFKKAYVSLKKGDKIDFAI